VPVAASLKTDIGSVIIVLDVGFLYEKLIFFCFVFFINIMLKYHLYRIEVNFLPMD
jgi:hypothetical protein